MRCTILVLNLALVFSVFGEMPQLVPGLSSTEVFTPEKDGYPHFRIPAIVTSQKGTVLVFAEGRQIQDDHARNDIVLKRSEDNGKTWNDIIIIHEDSELVMVNPSPVVIEGGRIILFYETFPHGLHARHGRHFKMMDDGYSKNRTQHLLMRTSDDDGKTWSRARDLTKISREKKEIISSGSPANGIQLQRGDHKGRILMPLFLTRKIDDKNRTWLNATLYSDDQGKTWNRSEYVPIKDTEPCNEVTIVELDNGDVMLNARPNKAKMRCVSVSNDGGQNWRAYEYDPVLAGRTCNSGILRYSYENPSRLIFCNNFNNSSRRVNGTIRISYDNGTTWKVSKQIVPGDFGYSQLCKLSDGSIGVIFEPFHAPNQIWSLNFIRIPLEWIEEGTTISE